MNNKPIKKAYEYYGGAWPDDGMDTVMYSSYHGYNLAKSMDGVSPYKSSSGGAFLLSVWEVACTKADFDAYGESLKEEWTPEVGKECEYKYKKYEAEFKSGVAKFIGNKLIVIDTNHGSYEQCYHIDSLEFRPLKTESEKQADAMFDIVKDATDTYHACELLVKNGYKKCAG